MQRQQNLFLGVSVITAFVATLGSAGVARAFGGAEAYTLGDQGNYLDTGAEVWVLPHRLGNIDNRAVVQFGAPSGVSYNSRPEANAPGAGLSLELAPGFNAGLWFSSYSSAPLALTNSQYPGGLGYRGQMSDFIANATATTGWWGPTGTLAAVNPYVPNMNPSRKGDLFLSYWLPGGLETGLHLWYGSATNKLKVDDSSGVIVIDKDHNPTTPSGTTTGFDQILAARQSTYSLSDLGISAGLGTGRMGAWRGDAGLTFTSLGVTWAPNDLKMIDAGGLGGAVNLRLRYDVNQKLTVGVFGGFDITAMHFQPKTETNGSNMPYVDRSTNAGLPTPGSPLATPPTGPNYVPDVGAASMNTWGMVSETRYVENLWRVQAAATASFRPTSRATVSGAVGFGLDTLNQTLSMGMNFWYLQHTYTTMALPFVHLGFEGVITDNLDILLGGYRRWQTDSAGTHYFDSRIPNDGDAGNTGNAPVPPASNSNAARRDVVRTTAREAAPIGVSTNFMAGLRVHVDGFAAMMQIDPTSILGGTGWVFFTNLIYDWDWDKDLESGNGSLKYNPHQAEGDASFGRSKIANRII